MQIFMFSFSCAFCTTKEDMATKARIYFVLIQYFFYYFTGVFFFKYQFFSAIMRYFFLH